MTLASLPPFKDLLPLGRAGRGRAYRATDAQGRRVALKVLDEAYADRRDVIDGFDAEFGRLSCVSHPAFPQALDQGHTPDGRPFYTMAWAPGQRLDGQQRMPAACVRACMADLAEALATLHAQGWVHGALAPATMLATPDARLFLLDTGLMLPIGTTPDVKAGLDDYMAPEPETGAVAADLYALGACAYQFWTGRPPFVGVSDAVRHHHRHDVPAPPGTYAFDADPLLDGLILALLAKQPSQRPDLATVLQTLGRQASVTVPAHAEAAPDLAEALSQAAGNPRQEARVRLQRLEAALAAQDAESAHGELAATQDLLETTPDEALSARLGGFAALLALLDGDPARAHALAMPWLACSSREAMHHARLAAAEAALALGCPHEAVAHGRVALAIAEDWKSPRHVALVRRTLDRALAARETPLTSPSPGGRGML